MTVDSLMPVDDGGFVPQFSGGAGSPGSLMAGIAEPAPEGPLPDDTRGRPITQKGLRGIGLTWPSRVSSRL
jgi:hypothetical protein